MIISDASMCKQYFTVVAAGGGAGFNYFLYTVQSSGSQPRGRAPPNGHQVNLRGREMINGREKKKKQTSGAQICFQSLDFSLIFTFFCLIQESFSFLGLKQLFP